MAKIKHVTTPNVCAEVEKLDHSLRVELIIKAPTRNNPAAHCRFFFISSTLCLLLIFILLNLVDAFLLSFLISPGSVAFYFCRVLSEWMIVFLQISSDLIEFSLDFLPACLAAASGAHLSFYSCHLTLYSHCIC